MKIALVAIIRNEAYDLLAWLGWHARLGVDTFVIFDDGSDDGTTTLLKAASARHDIRLFRITDMIGPPSARISYYERQRVVYMDALHGLKDSFDWIGFLDADEYLALHHHNTISDFLSRFDDNVHAVGIHWCVYGSNGYVTRPDMPPFHAFTRHSTPEHPINRHIKTFLRPQAWQEEWVNPHYFPLTDGHYVDAEGKQLQWDTTPGITATLPVWDTARIMHFQVRSLEQFVERVRRRTDLSLGLNDFIAGDCNDQHDTHPRGQTSAVLRWMRDVAFQGAAEALDALPCPEEDCSAFHPTEHTLCLSWVVPWDDSHLEIHDGWACSQTQARNMSAVFLLRSPVMPSRGFLFALDTHGRIKDFCIQADSRLTSFLGYDIQPADVENRVLLQQYGGLGRNRRYLTTIPNEPLIADRPLPNLWETFTLIDARTARDGLSWLDVPLIRLAEEAFQTPVTLGTLARLAQKDRHLAIRLLPLLHTALSPDERSVIDGLLHPFAPFVL